ncbi:MAG: glycerol-3-phosphate 1-O-acyltransferase [Alphaproteobacteria bacterium]|nr:MAG: glycerol-3-phosphate 1-O-acyltransferase [Alphaproteobacteria bacterium]
MDPILADSATAYKVAAVAGYLLGAVPFGLVLTRAAGLGDLRRIGSGNIGATNVLRTGNKALAALTLALDIGKGAAAVWLGGLIGGATAAIIAGLAAFFGHLYPLWLRFKGGKGVATALGVWAAWHWAAGAALAGVWLVFAGVGRFSSLAALAAAVAAPLVMLALGKTVLIGPTALMSAFMVWRHRGNIERLLKGTEPRIGKKD